MSHSLPPMRQRLEIEPDPTPAEYEVVVTALAEGQVLDEARGAPGSAWRQAGVEESVDRVPQPLSLRSSRGATRA